MGVFYPEAFPNPAGAKPLNPRRQPRCLTFNRASRTSRRCETRGLCDELRRMTERIRRSLHSAVGELRGRGVDADILGCALFTDDDAVTFFYSLCTAEGLAERDEDHLFEPLEWQSQPEEEFDADVNALIVELSQSEEVSYEEHVEQSFQAMTKALETVRDEGLFAPDAFLSVAGTDPSDWVEELGEKAVRSLNSASKLREYFLCCIQWKQSWLTHLRSKEEPLSFGDQDTLERLDREIAELSEEISKLT